eukprot:gene17163-biopygen2308
MRKNFQTSGFPACKLYGQLPVKFMPSTGQSTGKYGQLYGQSTGNHRITGNSMGNLRATLRAIYGNSTDHRSTAFPGVTDADRDRTATVSVGWLAFSRTHLN